MLTYKELLERINITKTKMGDVIKDFQDSDAPQFQGKSAEKRRQMAIAAKLEADRGVKEEVEELDELSRKTLASYTHKASRDMALTARKAGESQEKAGAVNDALKKAKKKNNYDSPAHKEGQKHLRNWTKRAKGIEKATNRLAKEELELEEGRMKEISTDMETMGDKDFKAKHRKSKQEMQSALKSEELKGNQHKIDANKNGKIDGHDFKVLRNAKKARYQ